ncbi:hypothetical protein OF83DRAFT_1173686 [Amylostereum chailletii]|nr:hypothetical protein OF83DRAFT_1173686 [Amylostereum chailletii]
MLSFALKIVWFVLALLGIVSAWLALMGLAKVAKAYWGPVLFSVAVTVLEGAFCLGMIWEMDTFKMPHAFCLAQAILICLSSNLIAGLCACLTWAIYATVFTLSTDFNKGSSMLSWKHGYLLLVLVFPATTTAAFIVVILKLDAVHPIDAMHCDASIPLWPRVLSYAGAPLALMLPCLAISVITISRVVKVNVEARKYRITFSTVVHSQTSPRNSRPASRSNSLSKLASNMHPSDERKMMEILEDHPVPAKATARIARSSQISLAQSFNSVVPTVKTTDTAVASSTTHVDPPPPPMPFSLANLRQPSPAASIRSHLTERTQTPSPITFAPITPPAPRRPRVSSHSPARLYLPSFPDPGAIDNFEFPQSSASLETATLAGPSTPSSPSRARVSFDDSEIRRGFHLPRRPSLDVPPRPSLELSLEYAKFQLERTPEEPPPSMSDVYGYPPSASQRVHSLRWVTKQGELREEDEATSAESVPYSRDRHGLIEVVRHGERENGMKEEIEFAENTATDVRSARSSPFNRFARRSPRSVSALPPVLWRMVMFQLYFATVLILTGLSTWIDLAKHRDPSPFGTQDVALLLVAWGPLFVFGTSVAQGIAFPH